MCLHNKPERIAACFPLAPYTSGPGLWATKKGSGEKEAAFHGNAIYDIDDDYFLGHYPGIYSTVGDVDYKNVRERNWRDGECFVTDVDRDGFIAEYDYTCYY